MKKKIIYTFLLITWMGIIFLFSNQNASKSLNVSDKFTSNLIDTVASVSNKDVSNNRKHTLVVNSRFLIRKCAHFTIYFILGLLSYLTLKSYGVKNVFIYIILFCFIYSVSDEVHQIFTSGRTFKLLDIFIDTSAGILLCYFMSLFDKDKECIYL